MKLASFGVFFDELFGDFGGFPRDFPQREGVKEDANSESMPREVYPRNTHTITSLTGKGNLCGVEARFWKLLERLGMIPGG